MQQGEGSFTSETGHHVEPMQLQVVCQRLWDEMPAEDLSIDPEDLEEFADVDASLGRYYQDCVDRLAAGDISRERTIRSWFGDRLITPGGDLGTIYSFRVPYRYNAGMRRSGEGRYLHRGG